jgi:cytosine permease
MSETSEEFATEPVPEERTVPWLRVGLISAMVAFSLPTFVTGIEVASAVDARTAIMAILAGNLLLSTIGAFCASIGARTRLSSYMLARVAFGSRGAAIVNLAFAVSLLGWFGVNIDLFGGAVLRLCNDVFGWQVAGWIVELGAGIVMTVTTIYGFRAINTLSLLLVPVLMVVTAMLVSQALGVRPLAETLSMAQAAELSFGDAMSSVVGGVIVGAIILPDITRFIREWHGAIYTAILSYLVIGSIVQGAGGLAATAFGNHDLLDVMIVIGLSWAAFAIVIAGSWILNSLNLYSTTLSIEATIPALPNTALIMGLGVFGTLAAFLDILEVFLTFLFYLAIVFAPVAGVIAVDYLWVRRSAYHEQRLQRERTVIPLALLAWAAGAAVALLGANGVISVTGIAALDAILVTAIAYGVLSRFDAHERRRAWAG